jgi:oligosaccharide repeat unit polymerase
MRIVYLLLLVVLLVVYGRVLLKVLKSSAGLTPLLGWLVGLAYFLLAPLVILTLNGGFELPPAYGVSGRWARVDLTNTHFFLPYLVIWASVLSSCLIIYIFFPSRRQGGDWIYSVSRGKLERVLLTCMAIAMVLWTLQIQLVGGLDEFLISHWYLRGEDLFSRYGDSYVLVAHLAAANQILFTGTAALYTGCGLKHRNTKWFFTTLILLFFLCTVVMTGNRIYLALYLLAGLTSCWLLRRRKLIAVMLAVAPALVLIFSAWSSLRHNLSEIPDSVDSYVEGDYGNRTIYSLMNVTEGTSVMLLLHMINDFGNRYTFLYGTTYSRTFLSLIPRSIYPNKPDSLPLVLARIYEPQETTSFGATAVGEMYANFGPLTLIFCPLFTFSILLLNRSALRRACTHPLLCPTIFVSLLWVARSAVAENVLHFIIAFALIAVFRLEKGLAHVKWESGSMVSSAYSPMPNRAAHGYS